MLCTLLSLTMEISLNLVLMQEHVRNAILHWEASGGGGTDQRALQHVHFEEQVVELRQQRRISFHSLHREAVASMDEIAYGQVLGSRAQSLKVDLGQNILHQRLVELHRDFLFAFTLNLERVALIAVQAFDVALEQVVCDQSHGWEGNGREWQLSLELLH